MRAIALCISTLTFLWLIYDFVLSQKHNKVILYKASEPQLVEPAHISTSLLAVEQRWQQLKTERTKPKEPLPKVQDTLLKNKEVLSLGGNKYALYGIFNGGIEHDSKKQGQHSNQAFILIKAITAKNLASSGLIDKVTIGQVLSQGITLYAVTSNSISFKNNDELITFKLFEAK
jgi:hypothetical protein